MSNENPFLANKTTAKSTARDFARLKEVPELMIMRLWYFISTATTLQRQVFAAVATFVAGGGESFPYTIPFWPPYQSQH